MRKILKNNPNLIYFLFFIILLTIHTRFIKCGDDLWFMKYRIADLLQFLSMRYETWSSRLIIETFLVISVNLPHIIWMIINCLFIVILARSMSYLFTEDQTKDKILSIVLVSILPLKMFKTAGWYATTINYLWTLGCGVVSLYPIKKILNKEKIRKCMYPIYSLLLLFACNQEQCCALIFGFYLLFSIYFILKDKKIARDKIFIYTQLLLTIISLIFIITCPGNANRLLLETETHYPTYNAFGLIQKLVLGINYSISGLLFHSNIVFLVFSIFLMAKAKKQNSIVVRIVSLVPVTLIAFVECLHILTQKFFPFTNILYNAMFKFSKVVSDIVILSTENVLVMTISIVMIGSIIFSLYKITETICKNKQIKYLTPIMYLAGILSIIMIGFSPTIYASDTRIFTYFDFILLSIMMLIYRYAPPKNIELVMLVIVGLLSLINIIVLP